MKKAILSRALMGFPMGIAIGQCSSLLVSPYWAGAPSRPACPAS